MKWISLEEAARKVAQKAALQAARRQAVREAWKLERELVIKTGQGTRNWTAAQIKELISTGKVAGFEGHHVNSVAHHGLDAARDPRNVRFFTRAEHFETHEGNWANKTVGNFVERTFSVAGPVLIDFSKNFDNEMSDISSRSSMVSDPKSWKSFVNPVNWVLEDAVSIHALGNAIFGDPRQ